MIEELLREYNATSDSYPIRQAFAVLEARAEAAEARVAELEAALDAAERERDDANDWQPVDTVPLETDVLLILRGQVFGQPGRQWVLATDEPFFCWRSV
jgi:multidrug efflux pump subunit AcrA (membrane-fusion protein)